MPSDAETGTIMVKVLDGTPATSMQTFTVEGPDPTVLAITSIDPTSGAVDAKVTIIGQSFGATPTDNMVIFLGNEEDDTDNKVATINEASPTKLKVVVPDGVVSGFIRVEVSAEAATSSQSFTVTDDTTPDVPFNVPNSKSDIRVYSNPASDEVHFEDLSSSGTYVYKMYSLLGQKIMSATLRGTTINVSGLTECKYVLVLRSEGGEILRTRLLIVR